MAGLTEQQIKHMVDRFLMWRLPEPWNPDNGVSYKRPNYAHAPAAHDWPVGTNLFDADQTTRMVRHMLEGLPVADARNEGIEEAAKQCRIIGDAERMADDTFKGWKIAEGAYKCEKAIRALKSPPAEGGK